MHCRIYKLCNTENDKIYVGSTKNSLGVRMSGHRTQSRNGTRPINIYIRGMGSEKFYIEELEHKEVENRQGQLKLELLWIKKLNPELNIRQNLDVSSSTYVSPEDNKENITKRSKTYRENNVDKIKTAQKVWRDKNKESENGRNKVWYQNNPDYRKEYYEKNKERINAYRRRVHNSEKNKARCKAYRDEKF